MTPALLAVGLARGEAAAACADAAAPFFEGLLALLGAPATGAARAVLGAMELLLLLLLLSSPVTAWKGADAAATAPVGPSLHSRGGASAVPHSTHACMLCKSGE